MSVKVVLQDGIKDCGICCLLSIIRFYDGEVSKEYLREITNTTRSGVTLYNLAQAAQKLGFETIGMSGDLTKIENNNLPCLAHIIVNKNYKHFVVIYSINHKNKQVELMDPAKGKKIISFSEFNLLSSGNFLFLKPLKRIPTMKKKNFIIKTFLTLITNHKFDFLLFCLLTIIFFILEIISSFYFKILLEHVIKYNVIENLFLICLIFFFFYMFKNFANTLRIILLNKCLTIFDEITTFKTYKQILYLPYLYYKNRTTGEVIARFKDLENIKTYLMEFLCFITSDAFIIIIFGFLLFSYQPKLFLLIILVSSIFFIVNVFNIPKKKKYLKKITSNEDYLNTSIIESINNVDTIKGSHLEKRLFDKFTLKYKGILNLIYAYSLNCEKISFSKNSLRDLLTLVIYGLGTYLVITTKITLGQLIVYESFYMYFLSALLKGLNLLEKYTTFSNSLSRIEDLFLLTKEEFKSNFYYLPYTLEGPITFTNLNYQIGNKYLFKNLNLTITPGDRILLSGPSGSGKSTLLKILMRYIEVPFNMVSIADIDINHYHLENIRQNITYVGANEYLFTDTLKNNICLYKEVLPEEFQKVIQLTLVDEFIPDHNYNKMVEENGFNFSYGEKQRIILARALLRNSNIYIFDEALSGIDINKEKKILTNIFQFLQGKTIIIISHRFNNKKLFNRILKLEKGQIYEL